MSQNQLNSIEGEALAISAEVLKEYFKELAGGSETEQAFLIQGMMGAGVKKVEDTGKDIEVNALVGATEDALIGLMQSPDQETKSLGMSLAFKFYEGARSARHAAIETSETPK